MAHGTWIYPARPPRDFDLPHPRHQRWVAQWKGKGACLTPGSNNSWFGQGKKQRDTQSNGSTLLNVLLAGEAALGSTLFVMRWLGDTSALWARSFACALWNFGGWGQDSHVNCGMKGASGASGFKHRTFRTTLSPFLAYPSYPASA